MTDESRPPWLVIHGRLDRHQAAIAAAQDLRRIEAEIPSGKHHENDQDDTAATTGPAADRELELAATAAIRRHRCRCGRPRYCHSDDGLSRAWQTPSAANSRCSQGRLNQQTHLSQWLRQVTAIFRDVAAMATATPLWPDETSLVSIA